MGKFFAIIDYGLGNLRSVDKAIEAVGARPRVTSEPEDIAQASAIVLPGVGAFQRAMDNLANLKVIPAILNAIEEGKPFMGICLGLQILFTESGEHGSRKGLDVIKGKVKKFSGSMKIPHMGWNQIKMQNKKIKIFAGIPEGSYFYFVHSYYVEPEDRKTVVTTTEYGGEFVSTVNKNNVWGVQFHPEKSERLGLQVLENFLRDVS